LCISIGNSFAQTTSLYLEDFTSNQTLKYSFGSFDLSTYPTSNSFSSEGLVTNIPPSSDSFGGVGVSPINAPVDITGTTSIQVTARADAGNQSDLVISIREAIDAGGANGEFFSYTIPASNFPIGGGFVTVSVDPTTGYNGDVTDGVLNGFLNDTGVQSPYAGTAAHRYTVQSVEFIGPDNGGGTDPAPGECDDPVSIHGALSVSGTNIVDENNNIVSFAGNSLFWSNTGWAAEKYYTAGVVQWLQEDWNTTIVRAAMGVDEFGGYLSDPQGNKNRVKTVVDAAIANGMYVIIDWHSHHAEDYESDAIAFFSEMAMTYGHHPNVIYEIYNEPLQVSWSNTIKPYAEAVIQAIRAIDPDNLIIVGSSNWSQDVDVASQDPITGYSNIAYTLHFYAGTHGDGLRAKAQTAINNGLALMVTEWGTVNASGDGGVDQFSTEQWLLFMNMHNLTHLNWSVHDKVEGASVLKPNASPNGGWSDSDLTASGLYVRGIVRDWFTCAEVDPFVLGDCNQDQVVDFADIPAFIAILSTGGFLDEADCDRDGAVNFLDIPVFIDILTSI
jgi:aryl-phospho-beta-D-glucosidase BglC (GH1 family)